MSDVEYNVIIEHPLSVNHIYATSKETGIRFMTNTHPDEKTGKMKEGGKQYAGFFKETKRFGSFFVPGRLHGCFQAAGMKPFPDKRKIVVEAYFTFPDWQARDCSNFQKPIEDALQDGGFVKNDRWILWQNKDFQIATGVYQVRLRIYELKEDTEQKKLFKEDS